MTIRSAPDSGYRGGFKPIYRRQVWRTLADGLLEKPSRQVLIMPSSEGDEIEWCEHKGFRRQNLHCVDRNPAIVAHLQRRYPGINTYGVELGDALMRMRSDGVRIDVANLDLCGQVSERLVSTVAVGSICEVWARAARVAVTCLRGREQPGDPSCHYINQMRNRWHSPAITDDARMAAIGLALSGIGWFQSPHQFVCLQSTGEVNWQRLIMFYAVRLLRMERYRSTAGNQTMLWSVFDMKLIESGERVFRANQWLKKALLEGNQLRKLHGHSDTWRPGR